MYAVMSPKDGVREGEQYALTNVNGCTVFLSVHFSIVRLIFFCCFFFKLVL